MKIETTRASKLPQGPERGPRLPAGEKALAHPGWRDTMQAGVVPKCHGV